MEKYWTKVREGNVAFYQIREDLYKIEIENEHEPNEIMIVTSEEIDRLKIIIDKLFETPIYKENLR